MPSRPSTKMIEFTLSRKAEKALPSTVSVEGCVYEIRPDFRTVLKILRMLNDPEVLNAHRGALLRRWFFMDHGPETGVFEAFGHFVRAGDEPDLDGGKAARDFDYEFDAPEIYASFRQLYGIDLFETSLHWWQFRALLGGCFGVKCALSEKLRLRNLDVSKCSDRAAAQRAKDSVQIPMRVSRDEQMFNDLLTQRLLNGEPIDDLLREVKM